MSAWLEKLNETFLATGYWHMMLEGLGNTVVITLGALVIGVAIGTLIAVIKYFAEDSPGLAPAAWLCDLYVKVIRGIPVVVLLLIFYFIIFSYSEGIVVAVLTFGINSGAYMAELIRSGIQAVDGGQAEAGRSLGLSRLQTMRQIIFPQAIHYILPAIGNEFVTMVKETSIIQYLGIGDLMYNNGIVVTSTYNPLPCYYISAIIYLALNIILGKGLNIFEGRLRKSER